MPITFVGDKDQVDTKFTKAQQKTADAWQQCANENKASLSGEFDAWHMRFELKGTLENRELEINGVRSTSNVSSNVIPVNSRFDETTTFILSVPNLNQNNLEIVSKKFDSKIKSIFKGGQTFKSNYNLYSTLTQDEIDKLILEESFNKLKGFKLQKLRLKGTTLFLRFDRMFNAEPEIQTILQELNKLSDLAG